MAFRVELAVEAERDFELIFDHLFESYRSFGESVDEALDHAARRVRGIRKAADRIARAPRRGQSHDDLMPGLRHLTIDRVIYWFEIDEPRERVRVLAVFFGGQDHVRRMLTRLLMP